MSSAERVEYLQGRRIDDGEVGRRMRENEVVGGSASVRRDGEDVGAVDYGIARRGEEGGDVCHGEDERGTDLQARKRWNPPLQSSRQMLTTVSCSSHSVIMLLCNRGL